MTTEERLSILCIFLDSGHTFTFRNVTIIHDNETVIQFQYAAMSDGKTKVGTFYKQNIVGVSRTA